MIVSEKGRLVIKMSLVLLDIVEEVKATEQVYAYAMYKFIFSNKTGIRILRHACFLLVLEYIYGLVLLPCINK